MATRAAACFLACLLAALSLSARAASDTEAVCANDRDRRLALIDDEALSVAVAFDTDAAVAESPEYQLLKDKETLLREIAEERQGVWERYHRCAAARRH